MNDCKHKSCSSLTLSIYLCLELLNQRWRSLALGNVLLCNILTMLMQIQFNTCTNHILDRCTGNFCVHPNLFDILNFPVVVDAITGFGQKIRNTTCVFCLVIRMNLPKDYLMQVKNCCWLRKYLETKYWINILQISKTNQIIFLCLKRFPCLLKAKIWKVKLVISTVTHKEK